MTTWRDRMQPASFRGVPFFVDTSEFSGGRRAVKHEYPLKDEPFAEDMGRKPHVFPIEGFVLGPDYFPARDALITALEKPGPGELIHPFYGKRQVIVDGDFRVRETSQDGGMARFAIAFFETQAKPIQPTQVVDASSQVATSATSAKAAVASDFLAKYNPGPFLTSVTTALNAATLKINQVLSKVSSDTQTLATTIKAVNDFSTAIATLVTEPASLIDSLTALFDSITDAGVLNVYNFNPGVRPPATTPTRAQEQANFDAVTSAVQLLSVIRAAELAPSQTYDSFQAALTAREAITDLIDAQAESAADTTYAALQDLQATLVQAVPGSNSDLPQLVTLTVPTSVPSLVLAWRLYGALDLESDIVTRNGVSNPGFIPGGTALEVLANG